MLVKIKLMDNGKMPQYGRYGDACLDCYSAIKTTIAPKERKLIPLGFALQLPEGFEGIIRPRSGLSSKGIDIALGTVDQNYIGEVKANVINNSDDYFSIEFGDRICQLAIRQSNHIDWLEVESLEETNRGSAGFGSSGVR